MAKKWSFNFNVSTLILEVKRFVMDMAMPVFILAGVGAQFPLLSLALHALLGQEAPDWTLEKLSWSAMGLVVVGSIGQAYIGVTLQRAATLDDDSRKQLRWIWRVIVFSIVWIGAIHLTAKQLGNEIHEVAQLGFLFRNGIQFLTNGLAVAVGECAILGVLLADGAYSEAREKIKAETGARSAARSGETVLESIVKYLDSRGSATDAELANALGKTLAVTRRAVTDGVNKSLLKRDETGRISLAGESEPDEENPANDE